MGDFLDTGSCKSCAENDSPDCPSPIKISVEGELEEIKQTTTIRFSPSLKLSLPADSNLSAEQLIQKYFKFSYKRKNGSEEGLTVLKGELVHDENGSSLKITFLEKMRVSNTELLKVTVKDPWLFRSSPEEAQQRVAYFKKLDYEVKIITKKLTLEEKQLESVEKTSKAIGTSFSFSILIALAITACRGSRSSAVYLIRFFNILDILSNLAKTNVKLGHKIDLVIEFIENLKFPELKFLAKPSPLDDSSFDGEDVNAYQIHPRGSRGKITEGGNPDMFIANGQNFLFSSTIIVLWGLLALLGPCLSKQNRILNFLGFWYQFWIGAMFFDYQMISVTEIAMFDFSTLRKASPKFTLSLALSITTLTLIVIEYHKGLKKIKNHGKQITEQKIDIDSLDLSENEKFILEKFTEGLELKSNDNHLFLIWVDNLRCFALQVFVATLQLLNRTQAVLILMVNLAYFIFYLRFIIKEKEGYNSGAVKFRFVTQEWCIMIFILTITLFSFTENSGFSSSMVYRIIELVTVVGIIVACSAEFMAMVASFYSDLTGCCKKKKVGEVLAIGGKKQVDGVIKQAAKEILDDPPTTIKNSQRKISLAKDFDLRRKPDRQGLLGDSKFKKRSKIDINTKKISEEFGKNQQKRSKLENYFGTEEKEHKLTKSRLSVRMRQKGVPLVSKVKKKKIQATTTIFGRLG